MPESLEERLANRRSPDDPDYDAFYDASDDKLAAMVPPPPITPEERNARTDGPIHGWFGLTYSNYLVLHRSLMQSMPVEWQERMVACLDEFNAAFGHVEQAGSYIVTAATECTYSDLSEADMKELGVTVDDSDSTEEGVFFDRDGIERQAYDTLLVPRRAGDPIPHYNRGRTFVEPRAASQAVA